VFATSFALIADHLPWVKRSETNSNQRVSIVFIRPPCDEGVIQSGDVGVPWRQKQERGYSPLALGSVAVSAEQRIVDRPTTASGKQAIVRPAYSKGPRILLQ
jgi:hypothetical protein